MDNFLSPTFVQEYNRNNIELSFFLPSQFTIRNNRICWSVLKIKPRTSSRSFPQLYVEKISFYE